MAYYSEKETFNPFLSLLVEKWDELIEFEGDTFVERAIRSCSTLIVVCCLALLIPIGVIISIYNSFYNLQKKVYDKLKYNDGELYSRFAICVEFGIYQLLSLPFLIILVPFWIFSALFIWLSEHKLITIIIILIMIISYWVWVYKQYLCDFLPEF